MPSPFASLQLTLPLDWPGPMWGLCMCGAFAAGRSKLCEEHQARLLESRARDRADAPPSGCSLVGSHRVVNP